MILLATKKINLLLKILDHSNMAKYFSFFPKTAYVTTDNPTGADLVTNITTRFSFEQELKDNSNAFYEYEIQESDTPEIIAYKYYGSSEFHWVVLMFNDIIDPQFDWPLQYNTFIKFVDEKYSANGAANTVNQSGLSWAMSQNNVHSYLKIVTRKTSKGDQTIEKITVDSNTYANISFSNTTYTLTDGNQVTESITKEIQTYYDYENEQNEKKRKINLLKKEFINDVDKEFKRVINGI